MQLPHQAYTSLPSQDQWVTLPAQESQHHDNSLTYREVVGDCEHNTSHNDNNGSQQWQDQLNTSLRSNPIAIARPHGGSQTRASRAFDTDDDDSDDGIVDVERDAMKIQRKYGAKVVAATTTSGKTLSQSALRAPYLGSLSRSENYMPVPPIRLSETFQGEAPSELGRGYGSLRDSQERGRFLDGPASYRDTRTGQIRQLNARIRYKGVARAANTGNGNGDGNVSIGERIQLNQKLKEEKRLKDNNSNDTNTESQKNGTSSLSAMMDQASKKEETETSPTTNPDIDSDWPPSGAATGLADLNEFGEIDHAILQPQSQQEESSTLMMSTSLTAFEFLTSANSVYRTAASGVNHSAAVAQSFHHQQPGIPAQMVRDEHFQPLSRSMSDPTPHLRSPRFGPRTTNLPPSMVPLGETAAADMQGAAAVSNGYYATVGNAHETSAALCGAMGESSHNLPIHHHHHPNEGQESMLQYGYHPTAQAQHNPDTDYAFDMDE